MATIAPSAIAQTLDEIGDMTVREYDELGMFVRAQIMEPVAKDAGVDYSALNACLKASAAHPILRRESLREGVEGCIEWAKEKKRTTR